MLRISGDNIMNQYATSRFTARRASLVISAMILTGATLLITPSRAPAKPLPKLLVLLDSSISMEDELAGELKYKLVRRAMSQALPPFAGKLNAGLMAFGRNSQKACKDVAQIIPLKTLRPKPFSLVINNIKPSGKSPISAAIAQAAGRADSTNGPLHMLLIADGGDNCGHNICATAQLIAERSEQTRIHVIGVGTTGSVKKLACIAKATHGVFKPVHNAKTMTAALKEVLNIALKTNR